MFLRIDASGSTREELIERALEAFKTAQEVGCSGASSNKWSYDFYIQEDVDEDLIRDMQYHYEHVYEEKLSHETALASVRSFPARMAEMKKCVRETLHAKG